MANILAAWPTALSSASQGMSANAFARQLAELGLGARRSEVLALYKIARETIAKSQDEPLRPTGSVPSSDEIGVWPTKNVTGFAHTVTLTYRDKTTGHIAQTWWRTTFTDPVTRQEAINEAIDAYAQNAEDYNQVLIGAAHTSTYRYQPVAIGG